MADNNDRAVDKFAGKGSVAGKLKEMREKVQQGKPTNPVVGGDPNLDAEGNAKDDMSEVENKHDSPNTKEFVRPREWSGRYAGLETDEDEFSKI